MTDRNSKGLLEVSSFQVYYFEFWLVPVIKVVIENSDKKQIWLKRDKIPVVNFSHLNVLRPSAYLTN